MSAKILFACSKCFSRHPFEELSAGQQLCKDCRGTFPLVKCTFCRSEFQQTSKGSTASICRKCEQSVKQYGKPSACECCNIIAAFIGSKCQRCANSELKYGPPVTCEQCKQRCAFDRHDENKKIDGKLLCWLCTLSFKKAVLKARQVEKDSRSKKRSHNDKVNKDIHPKKTQRNDIVKPTTAEVTEKVARPVVNNVGVGGGGGGGIVAAHAVTTIDPNSSDHMVAMTQLKEQIASLQKRLSQKDRELLEKDKQITELKGKNFTNENELRTKMKDSERLNDMKIDLLSTKVATLLKEVASLKKGVKRNGAAAASIPVTISENKETSSKDSGGSGTDSPNTN